MRRPAVVLAAALTAACLAGSASAALKLVKRAGGFSSPVYATSAPGKRGIFVVEQAGRIVRVHHGRRSEFLDISGRVLSGGEQGLLSVAFHPRFQRNHRFYVNYTNNDGDTRVVAFRTNEAGTRAIRSSGRVRIRVHQPYANHNGGQLQFGRDGLLYAAMGDGGAGGDPQDRAQDMDSRLGKLLALNVDDRDARARIVALGFRNPWRFAVDRRTGRFFIADVGQGSWEEIDTFAPGRRGLENYGWNRFEGNHLYSASNRLGPGRYKRPIHEYSHSSGRCSITGGFMVRGDVPGAGRYFYGDYCTGEVWSFRFSGGRKSGVRKERFTVPNGLSSFGVARGGSLLAVSIGGTVYRVAKR